MGAVASGVGSEICVLEFSLRVGVDGAETELGDPAELFDEAES